ncbi:MAG TPA: aminotransferase class V-fold PLP-dependent enzyme [Gemmatimonadales bacterium]|nr:aminotransferase class V-fold PLP-dependent enzyme [Gemmatimonadales bacterium]
MADLVTAAFSPIALRTSEFPWTSDVIYLNAAGIGPLPERSRRALEEFAALRAAPHRISERHLFGTLAESRRLAAALINADTAEIALAQNTSYGVNLAARALPLELGDIILLSDREFPANVYPWLAQRDRGAEIEIAPTTTEGWPDEAYMLQRMAHPRVKVLAVSLTQFANGYTVDLGGLSRVARMTGTYLAVDAIQAVGQMPVDVQRTPVDFLACGGQKWLLSPWGSGFVYVRRELIPKLAPADVGWLAFEGTDDLSRLTAYDTTLRSDARRYELVTLPYQDFAGFNASVGLLLEVGIEAIRDYLRAVIQPVLSWAASAGVRVASPQGVHGSAIVCLDLPDAPRAYRALKKEGIVATVREGVVRLSPHLYNTPAELERVAEALDTVTAGT